MRIFKLKVAPKRRLFGASVNFCCHHFTPISPLILFAFYWDFFAREISIRETLSCASRETQSERFHPPGNPPGPPSKEGLTQNYTRGLCEFVVMYCECFECVAIILGCEFYSLDNEVLSLATRSGMVLLDGETGDWVWREQHGQNMPRRTPESHQTSNASARRGAIKQLNPIEVN